MSELSSWHKSSYCGPQGSCVEVGGGTALVGVRDTKDRRDTLAFSHDTWASFITAVKRQELDQ